MIYMELGPSTSVGIGLISVGITLYALGKREPNVSRDLSQYYDFFFSSIGLSCGGIPIFQGWRLDPILLLSQMLLSGTAISSIAESLYLRSVGSNVTRLSSGNRDYSSQKRKKLFDFGNRLIYKNFESRMRSRIPCKKWERIYYTIHIPYEKGNKREKQIEL
nr:hypothetical protein [Huperzia sp. DW-2023a]